jgi:membrane protein implicated in regulation of membrane protease activity
VSDRGPGLLLIFLGVGLVVAGLLVLTGGLSWFGRLPGDIRWEGAHGRVYVPVVSMLLLSIVLSLVLSWFFRHRS